MNYYYFSVVIMISLFSKYYDYDYIVFTIVMIIHQALQL